MKQQTNSCLKLSELNERQYNLDNRVGSGNIFDWTISWTKRKQLIGLGLSLGNGCQAASERSSTNSDLSPTWLGLAWESIFKCQDLDLNGSAETKAKKINPEAQTGAASLGVDGKLLLRSSCYSGTLSWDLFPSVTEKGRLLVPNRNISLISDGGCFATCRAFDLSSIRELPMKSSSAFIFFLPVI